MPQALKENPLWRCKVGGPECMLMIFLVMSCPTFVGSLLLHLMIVWWYSPWWFFLSNSWWTIYKNLACSNTCYGQSSVKYCKNVAQKTRCPTIQPLDFLDKPIIVCYSSPASPLGVPSQAPSRLIRCLFEDCDGKKHFGTDVSSMTKGYKRLSWMCTPVSIW